MKLPRLLNTPLAATAGVLVGLSLLAIPLHQLTSKTPAPKVQPPEPSAENTSSAWVTLKLLEAADSIQLRTTDGQTLWSAAPIAAGDHEFRLELPISKGKLELILELNRPPTAGESAAFLTIAPDHLKQQTRYAIGSGNLVELLAYSWQQTH